MQVHKDALVKQPRRPSRRPQPVEHIVVRRDVWQAAMEIMRQRPDAELTIIHERRVEIIG